MFGTHDTWYRCVRRRAGVVALATWLCGCVALGDAPDQGDTQFTPGAATVSTDYDAPAGGAAGVSAAGPAGPGAAGTNPGMAGGVAVMPPDVPTAGGAPPPLAGSGVLTGGTGGSLAGGSGGASGALAGGAGGAAGTGEGGAGGSTTPLGGAAGTLTLDFTSVAVGGRYAPRNVGAVWIETASGQFVKTLERWAAVRAVHLSNWNAASGGWSSFFGIGATADEMDAISGATLRTHQAHHLTWDMQDPDGMLVPDGSYVVRIEVADDNFAASKVAEVAFDKGAAPVNVSPPDQTPYTGLTLTYTP